MKYEVKSPEYGVRGTETEVWGKESEDRSLGGGVRGPKCGVRSLDYEIRS
jgi:hypothetical protein